MKVEEKQAKEKQEIVHCGGCKFWGSGGSWWHGDKKSCKFVKFMTGAKDFCCFGEKVE